jgi:enterochelin esterase-like enzyme
MLVSPRIASLETALSDGNDFAATAFWDEIQRDGAPLVEDLADDPDHRLVTFVWRNPPNRPDPKVVLVLSSISTWDENAPEARLTRLGETALWYRTYRARADHRTVYTLSVNDPTALGSPDPSWPERLATRQPDSFNQRRFVYPPDPEFPNEHPRHIGEVLSVVELPKAPQQPWIEQRVDAPTGDLTMHRLHSDVLGYARRVWVYTPPEQQDGANTHASRALALFFDGFEYVNYVHMPTILDNLHMAGQLPATTAVFIDSPEGRRGELGCSPPFVDFLANELLPWLGGQFHIDVDPTMTVVAGASLGGTAAAYAGLRRPDLFPNVLSQSGAMWWPGTNDPEPEWLARQFAASPPLPLRFSLDVGTTETIGTPDNSVDDDEINTGPSLRVANRHLRSILQAKGYNITYTEHVGGHDWLCWQHSVPDQLLTLLAKSHSQG